MEKILGVIGDWLGENWGWIALAGVFVDISPIKFSPITGMLKWIGRKLTGEGGRGAAGAGGSEMQGTISGQGREEEVLPVPAGVGCRKM